MDILICEKHFLNEIVLRSDIKDFIPIIKALFIETELMYCFNLKVMDNQFKCSKYSWDICFNLSNCKQKWMQLFWVVWIMFVLFSLLNLNTRQNMHNSNEAVLRHYKEDVTLLVSKIFFATKEFQRVVNFVYRFR